MCVEIKVNCIASPHLPGTIFFWTKKKGLSLYLSQEASPARAYLSFLSIK